MRAVIFTLEDVTEHTALEEQLRLAHKMEALGQLTGGIAHDFNNLLNVISLNLELLQTEIGDSRPGNQQFLTAALAGVWRGAELTRHLLAFGRRQPLKPQEVDLCAFLPNLTTMLQRTLGKRIEVVTTQENAASFAMVDPAQLENAVLNLALNARDAMPDGGRLSIELANVEIDADYAATRVEVDPGSYVMLSVTDTGSGIPKELISQVFEPFFTTKEVGEGTGLGLSMVYGFVKQSDGHLEIHSEPGHGTSVKLYLPSIESGPSGTAQSRQPEAFPAISSEKTILVVEDDPLVRGATVALLTRRGFRVLEASDAKQALEVLHGDEHIDLLFTDLMLPGGKTGVDLARECREIRPATQILYTSGYSEAFFRPDEPAASDFPLLTKPYRQQALVAALNEAFGLDTNEV